MMVWLLGGVAVLYALIFSVQHFFLTPFN